MNLNSAVIPPRIQGLSVDPDRHLPAPWFVTWVNGKPDFRLVTQQRVERAVEHGFCWICGGQMGRVRAFVIGPMCAVNRVSAEPPSHRDCAVYAATHCPFLANPRSVRRETALPVDRLADPPGIMLRRNPGVALVWPTKSEQQVTHGTSEYGRAMATLQRFLDQPGRGGEG